MWELPGSDHDEELQTEAELCTALWIASSESDRRLTQDEVDQLLGAT